MLRDNENERFYLELEEEVAAHQKNRDYPGTQYTPGSYLQISKKQLHDKFANPEDPINPRYFIHKLHVSFELSNADEAMLIWNKVIFEIFKEPCVYAVKLISPSADIEKRQPGKEMTLYFVHEDDMGDVLNSNRAVSREEMLTMHIDVIRKLDKLIVDAHIKPSVAPKNNNIEEYKVTGLFHCKSDAIYIAPTDRKESGQYKFSDERESADTPYEAYMLKLKEVCDVILLTLQAIGSNEKLDKNSSLAKLCSYIEDQYQIIPPNLLLNEIKGKASEIIKAIKPFSFRQKMPLQHQNYIAALAKLDVINPDNEMLKKLYADVLPEPSLQKTPK